MNVKCNIVMTVCNTNKDNDVPCCISSCLLSCERTSVGVYSDRKLKYGLRGAPNHEYRVN